MLLKKESRISIVKHRFRNEKVKLIYKRDLVLKKVQANNKTEKVNDPVLKWLNDVEKLTEEVENLEKTIEETDQVRKYELYVDMLKKMEKLNTKCEFNPFFSLILGMEYFSSGNFVCFKSTEEASDQILKALLDDTAHIIGLYGRQGSGKTQLVKAMGEKAKYLKIFDAVLFANVSQNSNIRGIQDEIADSLNLTFDRNSEAGRARKIYSRLESMDRILLILDDVREKLDLEDIGIPCNGNGCKVLLTTRHQQQCALMDCHKEIPLYPLSREEAWTLLKKHSGIDNEYSSDLLDVAREVANECEAVPGTIKDVGSYLKGKRIKEWKGSLYRLRHSMARHHIFLSFRGEDTRYSFTGFLYDALCREGFKTFMDDGGLKGGDEISSSLIKAIEASRLSIIIFSKNFAYSSWCLDELVTILECKKMNNQLVWPIFYKVEPTDVRHQKNSFRKAMAAHENKFGNDSEKVKKWRSALSEIAGLAGLAHKTGYEYKFIQTIVEMANRSRLYIMDME